MAKQPRAKAGRGPRGGVERIAALAILVATIVLFVVTAAVEGPVVVEKITHRMGLKRVEAHAELLRKVGAEARIDPCLLAGIMWAESRGRLDAVSPRGALGLFQLMPVAASDAAKRLKLPEPTREELLTNAELNARLAANHLAWLVRNEGPAVERVLVAYNAGRGKMRGWIKDFGGYDAWRAERARSGKSESLNYAISVLEVAEVFRARSQIATQPEPPLNSASRS